MNDIATIIEKLKCILSEELGDAKVYDKDVAKALGVTPGYLASHKNRNTIPCEIVISFCVKRKVLLNNIFANQNYGLT